MDLIIFVAVVVGILIAFEVWFLMFWKKRRKLPKHVVHKVQSHLEKIHTLSEREQIMEYDKLLDFCLKHRGFVGRLGEKMKKFNTGFQNVNAIWSAHKMRNKIAHEVGYTFSDREFGGAVRAFEREIGAFIS